MTIIHVRKLDWYYANEHIGKNVILHADGYSKELFLQGQEKLN